MGISLRVFLVKDDDSIERFALSRYSRLHRHDPDERLPQYADKRVRFALVAVDMVDRKPVEIIRIQYSWSSFDSEGKIDPIEREKEAMLAMESFPPVYNEQESRQVINARHHFAKKRYKNEYLWEPNPEIENAIIGAIFNKGKR